MKKIIAPVALAICLLGVIVYSIITPSRKITIVYEEPQKPEAQQTFNLKVYVENSGSMDAYMCSGSTLKDAVYDYISDGQAVAKSTEYYYINSKIIPYKGSLDNYIKNLTPESFAKAGGNRANTDLRSIVDMILKQHKPNDVSVFVSDCILDISGDTKDYFLNCQISIKNTFNTALKKHKNLGVQIAKFESKFDGYWYCGKQSEKLANVKRPYYIWVIGDVSLLAKLNKKTSLVDLSNFGFLNYCAFSSANKLPFVIEKKQYVVNGRELVDMEIIADLSNSLQEETVLSSPGRYSTANPGHVSVQSITKIADPSSNYTHVINLELSNPQTIHRELINISYPGVPSWVEMSNDDIGINVKKNINKTTGLKYLITGVSEAFKGNKTFGHFAFEINNK